MQILHYGDRKLKQVAAPVTEFSTELEQLVEQMIEAMKREGGIGLAAPQVGVLQRIIVVDTTSHGGQLIVMINPEITSHSSTTIGIKEGCLSIPGFSYKVPRRSSVELKGQNVKGEEITVSAEGLLAIALQHELDHLNGVLFIDYIKDVGLLNTIKKKFRIGMK
jgi:peptide deformylase